MPPSLGVKTRVYHLKADRTVREDVLHPQALRDLKDIEIVTSTMTIWRVLFMGPHRIFFPGTRELILKILRTLVNNDNTGDMRTKPSARTKTLKFTVMPGKQYSHRFRCLDDNWREWFGGDRAVWDDKLKETKGLLDEVGKVGIVDSTIFWPEARYKAVEASKNVVAESSS